MEKIYIRTGYTDMRKQLDGLIDIIQYSFRLDPYGNSLFLFCGKRVERIKAVHYEGDGFCLSISATKTAASSGRAQAKKPDRSPISSSAGCWRD